MEAVEQITERGHRVADVSARICVSQRSLYKWIKTYAVPEPERQLQTSQTEELRRLYQTRSSTKSMLATQQMRQTKDH
nr:transposase [Acidovorax delafieldii]